MASINTANTITESNYDNTGNGVHGNRVETGNSIDNNSTNNSKNENMKRHHQELSSSVTNPSSSGIDNTCRSKKARLDDHTNNTNTSNNNTKENCTPIGSSNPNSGAGAMGGSVSSAASPPSPNKNQEEKNPILSIEMETHGNATLTLEESSSKTLNDDKSKGEINFQLITNDNDRANIVKLIQLKNIFAKQLPKMPKEYIVRLVFDRRHKSLVICKGEKVIGGICYRPYDPQEFAEIAFCAITATEQVKGYGTRVMNHLKENARRDGIRYFLTYADNFATGYFTKQGFTKTLALPRDRWFGYIKDYDGGTLMECYIHPTVNFLDVPGMIQRQREFIYKRVQETSKAHTRYKGLTIFQHGQKINNVMTIPGIKEAGWLLSDLVPLNQRDVERERINLQNQLKAILKQLVEHKLSWPFTQPVDTVLVPDYLDVISNPIDLSLIMERVKRGDYYKSKHMMFADLERMTTNCKTYNKHTTQYYQIAVEYEKAIRELFKVETQSRRATLMEE